jgi:hypothetical protein
MNGVLPPIGGSADMGPPPFSAPDAGMGALGEMSDSPPRLPPDQDPNFVILPQKRHYSPPKAHLEYMKEEVPKRLKRSAEFVAEYVPLWKTLWDLYWNRLKLSEWGPHRFAGAWRPGPPIITSRADARNVGSEGQSWRADYTIAVSPLVDNRADAFVEATFSQDEFFQVRPTAATATGSIEDYQFPTSRKIQAKVHNSCRDVQFRTSVAEAAKDEGIFGTVACKVPWWEEKERIEGFNILTGQRETRFKTIRQGAPLTVLNLARFLPDPEATNSDCQRWQFVGDRTEVEWETIKSRFRTRGRLGPYNIGYSEFMEKWPDGGGFAKDQEKTQLKEDLYSENTNTTHGKGRLQVWEIHGKFYLPGDREATECVATMISDLSTDDPSGGVLVRFQERPALKVGLRPYVVGHDIPQSGPFGIGTLQQNLDLIWLLSHCINNFIDAARLLSIPITKAKEGSPFYQQHQANQSAPVWHPGKIIPFRNNPNEVEAFSLQIADLGALLNCIQYLERQLEKRTAVSDATRGVSQNRKTATEVHSLVEEANKPINTKLELWKETVLDRYAAIAVGYLQSRVFEDQQIYVKGPDGKPMPVSLTVEELQSGEYQVEATLGRPDRTKISKAQTIMQVLPMLEQLAAPLLQFENKVYKRAGLIEALLRFLDIHEITTTIEDVDEQTKQQIMASMMPQPMPGQGGHPQGADQVPPGAEQGIPPEQMDGQMLPGTDGGPMGPLPSALNEILQRIQFDAENYSPVPIGGQAA